MKLRYLWSRPARLTACLFLFALAAIAFGDGSTQRAWAQLTTADCKTCHTEASWYPYVANGIYSAAASAHHSKFAIYGCFSIKCHSLVPTSQARNNCIGCHGTGGHQASHDKTALPSTECATCHVPNVYDEHAQRAAALNPDGSLNCAVCHKSTNPDIVAAIAKGRGPSGQTVYCDECHTGMGTSHEADHDKTVVNGAECLQCHVSNVVTEHVTNRGWYCSACHSSAVPEVVDAIARGKGPAGVDILCSDCHGLDAISHQAVHDHALLPTVAGQDCTQCHAANVVTEHVTNRGYNCAICHNSARPEVLIAIENGRTPNNISIYCSNCHSSQGNGHLPVNVEPWNQCLRCHKQTNFGGSVHITHELEANNDCSVCHAPAPQCTNCHDNNSEDPWLDIVGPGDQAHDRHTDVFALACTQCHTSGAPGGTPIPPPYNACDTCHTTLAYGKVTHNSHMTAAGGNCALCHTEQPDCGQCHAAGHPPVPAPYSTCDQCHTTLQPGQTTHNAHRTAAADNCATCHSAQPNCGQCHAAGHPPVPAPYDTCDQCHTTLQAGQATHEAHRTAAADNCATCHTAQPNCGQCHAAGHPPIPAPYDNCDRCHSTLQPGQATHVLHVQQANNNCALCHTAQPNCSSCHTQDAHHATTQAKSGQCTHCHADPRLVIDPNAPKGQLACRQCHGTNMHGKGGPIQDYGACFACHSPAPYHAKPATRPRDCYSTTPGKGSFNLFYREFGGGGEHDERNERCENRRSDYSRPAINYSMVTIYDYFTTKKQWSVPTFGTGSGSGTDTVTITQASYDSNRRRITVYATSSLGNKATLTAKYGSSSYSMSWSSYRSRWEVTFSASSCSSSSTVQVVSSAGGSASKSISGCSGSGGH